MEDDRGFDSADGYRSRIEELQRRTRMLFLNQIVELIDELHRNATLTLVVSLANLILISIVFARLVL